MDAAAVPKQGKVEKASALAEYAEAVKQVQESMATGTEEVELSERVQVSLAMLPEEACLGSKLGAWRKNYRVPAAGGSIEVQLHHRLFRVIKVSDEAYASGVLNYPWCSYNSVMEAWEAVTDRVKGGELMSEPCISRGC